MNLWWTVTDNKISVRFSEIKVIDANIPNLGQSTAKVRPKYTTVRPTSTSTALMLGCEAADLFVSSHRLELDVKRLTSLFRLTSWSWMWSGWSVCFVSQIGAGRKAADPFVSAHRLELDVKRLIRLFRVTDWSWMWSSWPVCFVS